MLKNKKTQTINTERLVLRKFRIDDIQDFYNNVGNDEIVDKYVIWNRHKDTEETKEIITRWLEDYKNDYVYRWAVEIKATKEIIGSISCFKVDLNNLTCEVGYAYGSKFWNQGYATEALIAVLNYLKKEGFKTVYADHLKLNPASGKVMEKSGMEYEGVLRNRIIDKTTGKYDDLVYYSIFFE